MSKRKHRQHREDFTDFDTANDNQVHPMSNPKQKRNWKESITNWISKIFDFFKLIIHIIWTVINQLFSLIIEFFSHFLFTVSSPVLPCIISIIFFMLVVAVTGYQWWFIGLFWAKALSLTGGFYSIGSGTLGVLLGLGINAFQLSPELWKLQKKFAKAYASMKVDVDKDTSNESVKDKLDDWFSYDHALLKRGRDISYGVETCIVLVYIALAEKFAFLSLVIAAASLLLPEKSIKMVSATVSLLGEVSNRVASPGVDGESSGGRTAHI